DPRARRARSQQQADRGGADAERAHRAPPRRKHSGQAEALDADGRGGLRRAARARRIAAQLSWPERARTRLARMAEVTGRAAADPPETTTEEERMLITSPLSGLEAVFAGELILPGDPRYDTSRSVFNAIIDRRPALIARCSTTLDVAAAVRFAR